MFTLKSFSFDEKIPKVHVIIILLSKSYIRYELIGTCFFKPQTLKKFSMYINMRTILCLIFHPFHITDLKPHLIHQVFFIRSKTSTFHFK